MVTLSDLLKIASEGFAKLRRSAQSMRLSNNFTESVKYAKSYGAQMLSDRPEYEDIEEYQGMRAWCAALSFDIRKSTDRALRIGPRNTFITMHTFLPTMLALVDSKNGSIVGLRGDGAIACFSLHEMYDSDARVPDETINDGVKRAGKCGVAMLRAVQRVVNPVLAEGGVEADLRVGIGIDIGEIVATNIGLGGARELTAYGNCVNRACKLNCANDAVLFSRQARFSFPKTKGGKATFRKSSLVEDAFVLEYPPDFDIIEQE